MKINRSEFVKISTGIIGGLGIPGVLENFASAAATEGTNQLDESYLSKGLIGMARASDWFPAHWGAAVLAGYYLCKENNLGEETVEGIKKQLDGMLRVQAAQFEPFPEESADAKLIDNVTAALPPAMEGGLRAHGHAVIFASLSTKALRDAPQMAQPKLINKLCGLSQQIARKKPEKPADETTYADTQAMIEATFDNLARFEDLLGRPSVLRPNFTHMVTHTEALLNLESMGYPDLAKAGYPGHRAHIGAPVPNFEPGNAPRVDPHATLKEIVSEKYWENPVNQQRWNKKWDFSSNPNGSWVAFGHLFKVLYSYHRLVGRIEDKEKVQLCSRILLERYFNPDVKGG